MPAVTFYRQKRKDGGVRTGIEIDGEVALFQFTPGGPESNPALEWYVDITASGPQIPGDPDGALRWLIALQKEVQSAVLDLADQVPAGIDAGDWPLRHQSRAADHSLTISCSAVRRKDAHEIAAILREIAERWVSLLTELHAQPASANGQ